jgi:hypothetical protein
MSSRSREWREAGLARAIAQCPTTVDGTLPVGNPPAGATVVIVSRGLSPVVP